MVGGGLEIVICGSGHGIGANAGKPLPTSYQTIPRTPFTSLISFY